MVIYSDISIFTVLSSRMCGFSSTCNIAKKGFSGMRSSSPASISLYLDSEVLRNPFQAILPTLATSLDEIREDNFQAEKSQRLFLTVK
jgi:hypothetical protein